MALKKVKSNKIIVEPGDKIKIIDKNFNDTNEYFVLWIVRYEINKIWYCVGENQDDFMAKYYLGPSQIEKI